MTTPQDAARTALARVLPTIDLRYSDGSGFGPGLDGAMFEDHEADHWADAILAALQADPDAARAVVALLGEEALPDEVPCPSCKGEAMLVYWCENEGRIVEPSPSPAPQDDREAALRDAQATIEAMSGDAADLTDLMDEAAALRTALAHVLVRTHDSGCGTCDAARALLTADHELPSLAARLTGAAEPLRPDPGFLERPCPACGAAVAPADTHWNLMTNAYECPVPK